MHGQQSVSTYHNGFSTPPKGKVLSNGTMPPHPDSHLLHPPSSLAQHMNGLPGSYHLDPSGMGGTGGAGGLGGSGGGGDSNSGDGELYGLEGPDAKRKKGAGVAGKSIEEELCRICGDRASGYHYNALSCEGCKGFFRRSITKTASYACKYGGNCEMDMWMRRKCQACRLRRCREVGMKEECLLSEDQCKARDARRKSKQKPSLKKESASPDSNEGKDHPPALPSSSFSLCSASSSSSASTSVSTSIPLGVETKTTVVARHRPPSPSGSQHSDSQSESPLVVLSREHQEIIHNLTTLQEKYEYPQDEDVKRATLNLSTLLPGEAVEPRSMLMTMADMTVLITHLIVEFAKSLPGFLNLEKDDQIILLKAASSEIMAIRAARCYDPETKAILFANGSPCNLENMLATGLGKYAELVFEFCHNMSLTHTDNAEYALLSAISIFSERPGLRGKAQVEKLQSTYVETLHAYEIAKRHKGSSTFAKFLTRLSDLRNISVEHSNLLLEMERAGDAMPPLINECFILPPEGS